MSWTAETWPIGAALLQFPNRNADGTSVTDAPSSVWHRTMKEVRLAGFDHVDLTDTWVPYGDLSPERRRELMDVLADVQLGISALSMSRRSILDHDPDQAKENLAYTYRTINAAAEMGIRTVCIGLHQPLTPAQQEATWFWHEPGAADSDDPEVYAYLVDNYKKLGRYAAELGVILSMEMYEDTLLGTADKCVRLATDIDLPNVGINPDLGNLLRLHRPFEDWKEQLRKMLPFTNYWHVKNYYRDVDQATGAYATSPAPLAMGYINYRDAITMALEAGFEGTFCVEHYGGDGLTVGAMNRDYLREILRVKLQLSEG